MQKIISMDLSENVVHEKTSTAIKEKTFYDFIKRMFDVLASLTATVVLFIPMIILAIIISVKDKGSPFYFQKRVGKNGKLINVCKFRSMKNGSDNLEKSLTEEQLREYYQEYKLKDDPRLIGYNPNMADKKCFGEKLRELKLDELPQITYNILIAGNMTIVGPRPILEDELAENYSEEERKQLLSVKPGLTGYWQVFAGNKAGYADGKRQQMELYYVENRSLLLDLRILFKTVSFLLIRE